MAMDSTHMATEARRFNAKSASNLPRRRRTGYNFEVLQMGQDRA
jgi:hypothetical protein